MSSELVHVDIERGIATVTLDSPHNRNALSNRLVAELADALTDAAADPEVRAVVLTATGTTFCSGADLSEAADTPAVPFADVVGTVMTYPKPVITRLNGHVRAGGIGLVAASDICVAPPEATFAFTEVRLGLTPAVIGVPSLRRMSPIAARRFFLTGERFDAAAAHDAGLVTIVADDVDAATEELCAAFRLTEPHAVAVTKELLATLVDRGITDGLAHAKEVSADLFASEAAAEGIASFKERRPPRWAVD